jgi:uncharacterized membrane protein YidH (DUF202 family)
MSKPMRTSIALFAAGGTLAKVFPDDRVMVILGIILLALGAIVALAGIVRFASVKKRLARAYEELAD